MVYGSSKNSCLKERHVIYYCLFALVVMVNNKKYIEPCDNHAYLKKQYLKANFRFNHEMVKSLLLPKNLSAQFNFSANFAITFSGDLPS